jgi:hypothetical protein
VDPTPKPVDTGINVDKIIAAQRACLIDGRTSRRTASDKYVGKTVYQQANHGEIAVPGKVVAFGFLKDSNGQQIAGPVRNGFILVDFNGFQHWINMNALEELLWLGPGTVDTPTHIEGCVINIELGDLVNVGFNVDGVPGLEGIDDAADKVRRDYIIKHPDLSVFRAYAIK